MQLGSETDMMEYNVKYDVKKRQCSAMQLGSETDMMEW